MSKAQSTVQQIANELRELADCLEKRQANPSSVDPVQPLDGTEASKGSKSEDRWHGVWSEAVAEIGATLRMMRKEYESNRRNIGAADGISYAGQALGLAEAYSVLLRAAQRNFERREERKA